MAAIRRRLPFLLEIGAEEIPAWMISPALEQLRALFEELLGANRLGGEVTSVEATPRRLVLMAKGIAARQADTEDLVMGPPAAAGENAAAGFARKMGVEPGQLERIPTPKGEYLGARKKIPGRLASEILAAELPGLVLKLNWPKTMYWTGKSGPRFIRPIRWIVALLGKDVVPFEIAGVASGNVTRGHRQLGKPRIRVTTGNYVEKLRAHGVIVSAAERRRKIESEIHVRLRPDAELLETLVNLTEYPTPIVGSFDEQYLSLPPEVLVTVMRHHQKYFSVEREDGSLAPQFVAVMNTSADPEGLVRQGNERVLRARFNDARFFWDFDQQVKLADRVELLAHVTFQAQLGSYKDKTERVAALVREWGGSEHAIRAASLAKCDLTCEMVKEFTELQGVVGGLYARAQGEPEEVAAAIYDHYKPESMEDGIPRTREGQLVSLADKVDTLRGCFRLGLIPSGSRDPFALRRAAQGVVKILVEGGHSIPVSQLAGGDPALKDFLLDRVAYYFREIRGFRYDEVNAVMAAGCEDLVDVERRLAAIHDIRPTGDFEPLAASFKRIANILKQAGFSGGGRVDEALLEAGPEATLYRHFQEVRAAVSSSPDCRSALAAIASLRPSVDLFFDKVLVNAPDEALRRNRLAMLSSLLTEFSAIADFSEIVTG